MAVERGFICVVPCYLPPSWNLADFEAALDAVAYQEAAFNEDISRGDRILRGWMPGDDWWRSGLTSSGFASPTQVNKIPSICREGSIIDLTWALSRRIRN